MINDYKKFINSEIFTKDDILKILDNNDIKGQIIDIQFYHFKKIYIKIKEGEETYLLKLCLDKYSINLSKNENKGYSYFANVDKLKFTLPYYKLINLNENYGLSKIKLINGKKGNYFELTKFYNNDYSNTFTTKGIEEYISLFWKRFQISDQDKKKINEVIDLIFVKYKSTLVPMEASHGDLINFNTIKDTYNYYTFDLEFFLEDRSSLYDYFHWYLTPFINKFSKTNFSQSIFIKTSFFLVKFLYSDIKKKNNLFNKEVFEVLLILFLIERCLTLSQVLNLDNFDSLVSKFEKCATFNNYNLTYKLLHMFANKLV